MSTQQRWGGMANPKDLTGFRQRELIAQAERDKAVRQMTAEDLAQQLRDARRDGWRDGYADGFESMAALLVESGAITSEALQAALGDEHQDEGQEK